MDNLDKNADVLTILDSLQDYAAEYEARKKKQEEEEQKNKEEAERALAQVEKKKKVTVFSKTIFLKHIFHKWAIISKTSVTDAVFAEKTIPQMRFLQVLTLWTCFPCMFDMSTMLKLC